MKVFAVVCKICGDTIFSRARHDFRKCSCGKTFVDGGFDYIRYGGEAEEKFVELEIDASRRDLYQDWGNCIDKYGLIKKETN
jgi:hypothetical protein